MTDQEKKWEDTARVLALSNYTDLETQCAFIQGYLLACKTMVGEIEKLQKKLRDLTDEINSWQ